VTTNPNSEAFYSGALDRISRLMLVLAIGLSATAWLRYGWRIALGVLAIFVLYSVLT